MNFLSDLLTIYAPFLFIVWFIFRKNKLGLNLLLIFVVSVVISVVFKELFKIGSNEASQGFQLSKYRFPSLSVELAVTFWLYLSMKYKKVILYIIASLVVIFVAYEKLVSKQHNLLDILVGALIGLLIVFMFTKINKQAVSPDAKI